MRGDRRRIGFQAVGTRGAADLGLLIRAALGQTLPFRSPPAEVRCRI